MIDAYIQYVRALLKKETRDIVVWRGKLSSPERLFDPGSTLPPYAKKTEGRERAEAKGGIKYDRHDTADRAGQRSSGLSNEKTEEGRKKSSPAWHGMTGKGKGEICFLFNEMERDLLLLLPPPMHILFPSPSPPSSLPLQISPCFCPVPIIAMSIFRREGEGGEGEGGGTPKELER